MAEAEQEYNRGRDALEDERYDTKYNDALYRQDYDDAWDRWRQAGTVRSERDAEILGYPVGTRFSEDAYDNTGSGYSGGYTSGGGSSSGGSKTGADTATPGTETTTPGSGQYDESGKRTGTWTDADGYTYVGYHPDGQWKSQGYDAAWVSIQALAQSGASKETVLTRIKSLVAQDRITDYEAEMMLVNLGYRTSSAGTGRNTIGPNNVQMVQ